MGWSFERPGAVAQAAQYIHSPRPLFTRLPFDYRRVPLRARVAALRAISLLGRTPSGEDWVRSMDEMGPGYAGGGSALVVTHDIDSRDELAAIPRIRALEERMGVVSAWGFVPSSSWPPKGLIDDLLSQGCEAYWHDIRHDGSLPYRSPSQIRSAFDAVERRHPWAPEVMRAFRAGQMLMSQALHDVVAERFDIDLSIPTLELGGPYGPAAGCGTVHPFRMGRLLEIPLTLEQDVFLLGVQRRSPDQALEIWLRQAADIRAVQGLIVINAHPVWLDEAMLRRYAGFLEACSDLPNLTPSRLAGSIT